MARNANEDALVDPPHLENPDEIGAELETFISQVVEDAGANGVVVNLSGGLDSTVTATLAVEALGNENVTGLILPAETNTDANLDDARQVAEELVIDYRVTNIQPLVDQFRRELKRETQAVTRDPLRRSTHRVTAPIKQRENYREALGNVAARIRMMVAYFEANTTAKLVVGTGNRTELLLGYFTKYGDGGVDLLPIGELYKTQVRDLARHLGIRDEIIEKKPTAGLWEGQADEAELGASYELIDTILTRLIDKDEGIQTVADATDVDEEVVQRYMEMYERAAHKRTTPPTPSDYE